MLVKAAQVWTGCMDLSGRHKANDFYLNIPVINTLVDKLAIAGSYGQTLKLYI